MDITATFRGVCKARKTLDKNVAALSPGQSTKPNMKLVPKPSASEFQKKALGLLCLLAEFAITSSRIGKTVSAQPREFRTRQYLSDANGVQSRRTDIENEVLFQLKSCSEALGQLRQDVHHNRTQIKTHRTAVVEILNAYIASVSKMFADQQAVRVKRELDHARMLKLESAFGPKNSIRPEELEKRPQKRKTAKVAVILENHFTRFAENTVRGRSESESCDQSSCQGQKKRDRDFDSHRAVVLEQEERDAVRPAADAFSLEERQMFESENADLFQELSGMEDDVKRIENQLTEISKLQQVFTENILVQEHQIDDVAATAVSANENIKAGNIDIREAIQKTASFRAWILFVVLVLSFTLLFLDWYNE